MLHRGSALRPFTNFTFTTTPRDIGNSTSTQRIVYLSEKVCKVREIDSMIPYDCHAVLHLKSCTFLHWTGRSLFGNLCRSPILIAC